MSHIGFVPILPVQGYLQVDNDGHVTVVEDFAEASDLILHRVENHASL